MANNTAVAKTDKGSPTTPQIKISQQDLIHGVKRVVIQSAGAFTILFISSKAKEAMEKKAQANGKTVSKFMKTVVPGIGIVLGGLGSIVVENDELGYLLEGVAAGGTLGVVHELLKKEDGTSSIQLLGNPDSDNDDVPTNAAIAMLDDWDDDNDLQGPSNGVEDVDYEEISSNGGNTLGEASIENTLG